MDVEESHRCGRLGGGGERDVIPRSIVHEISTEETERSKNGKGFKGPGGEHVKNYGQQGMSVRTPEGFARKSTCRRKKTSRVSISLHSSRERLVHREE